MRNNTRTPGPTPKHNGMPLGNQPRTTQQIREAFNTDWATATKHHNGNTTTALHQTTMGWNAEFGHELTTLAVQLTNTSTGDLAAAA